METRTSAFLLKVNEISESLHSDHPMPLSSTLLTEIRSVEEEAIEMQASLEIDPAANTSDVTVWQRRFCISTITIHMKRFSFIYIMVVFMTLFILTAYNFLVADINANVKSVWYFSLNTTV